MIPRRSPSASLRALCAAIVILCTMPAGVPSAAGPELSAADRESVARVEAFLDSLRTVAGKFVQTTSSGGFAEGTLYLSRPGNMRISYAPPTPLEVFADNTWLIYIDEELKDISQLPVKATPAEFLLRDRIRLTGDVEVTAIERSGDLLRVHLRQAGDTEAGRLILNLGASPLSLRGWTVIDPQGVEITVTLYSPAINQPIASSVFVFTPPDWAYAPEN